METVKNQRPIIMLKRGRSNVYAHAAAANAKEAQLLELKLEALDIEKMKERKRIENRKKAISLSLPSLHSRVDEKNADWSPPTRRFGECFTFAESVSLRKNLAFVDRPRNSQGFRHRKEKELDQSVGSTSPRLSQGNATPRARFTYSSPSPVVTMGCQTHSSVPSKGVQQNLCTAMTGFITGCTDPSERIFVIQEDRELLQKKIRTFYQKVEKECRIQDQDQSQDKETERRQTTADNPPKQQQSTSRSISLPAIIPVYNQLMKPGDANEMKKCRYLRVLES